MSKVVFFVIDIKKCIHIWFSHMLDRKCSSLCSCFSVLLFQGLVLSLQLSPTSLLLPKGSSSPQNDAANTVHHGGEGVFRMMRTALSSWGQIQMLNTRFSFFLCFLFYPWIGFIHSTPACAALCWYIMKIPVKRIKFCVCNWTKRKKSFWVPS